MLWSKAFIPTLKVAPQEAESISHQLMLRAGLIRMLVAGVYSYLPLGLKVLNNIENIIRQEMNAAGANELLLPALQPRELWLKSGRDKDIGEVMIRFMDRRGRNMCLGPTHEEIITELVRGCLSSYKQLPVTLYQIQTKFRDEIRPRFGLIRACEFIMKDAYSFDQDEDGLNKSYQAMHTAYNKIFKRCGLDFLSIEADSGVMGGKVSHEFMVPASNGEDAVLRCPECKSARTFKDEKQEKCLKCKVDMLKTNSIEVGHIFQLGTKYSSALGANFLDNKGKLQSVIMGCYGIGVSRLLPTIIEQNHDDKGIIWPDEITPYKVVVLALDPVNKGIMDLAFKIYDELNKLGIETILDDRDERVGVKFKDADLVGIPLQIVVGKDSISKNTVELNIRRENKKIIDIPDNIIKAIQMQITKS